uniref:Uncharacterized protein n=1 Tax=Pristionchus pacificus TaxID=54126 RepID=A0A8R1Z3N9_PRIPA|eukprot:PDM71780.1 hypothetical protein PRIPAC_38187 [Pristionchus pacificus]
MHGRDELWLQQQQQQRLRVMDAERAATRVQKAKAVASRSTPAVVRLSEATGEQTTPAFGTHSTPTVVRPSEQTTPAFGSRSTTAVVRPNEARETTDVQATPPAFGIWRL